MTSQSSVLTWDTLRSLASSSISGTYAKIGTALTYPARLIKIVNNSNQDITISIDGTSDYDYIPAGGFTLYDCGTNRGNPASSLEIRQGTAFYAKGTSGTGNVYVVCLYAFSPTQTLPGE